MNAALTFFTLQEVADVLKVSLRTVTKWREIKAFDVFEIDNSIRVSEEQLTQFVLRNTLQRRKPDWLTPEIEQLFERKIEGIAERKVNELLGKAA